MNRKQLYLDLCERLSSIELNGEPIFKNFDLWNNQLADKAGKIPYELPAVFIQFSPIQWTPLKMGIKEGNVDITFLIMSSTKGATTKYNSEFMDQALERLDYPDFINFALRNWKPYFIENEGEEDEIITQYASTFIPVGSNQSFDYDDVVVDTETYRTKLKDYSAQYYIKHSMKDYDLTIGGIKAVKP